MPCARELLIFTILFIISIFILSQVLLFLRRRNREPHFSTLDSITRFLNPPGAPLQRLLQERASANQRLSRTLNLTNTFVKADVNVHEIFVQKSRSLLKNAQSSGWTKFQDICGLSVKLSLNEYPSLILSNNDNKDIPFDHFIQIVVLRTILVGLLDIGKDVDELDIRSLASVTTLINQLWTYSKSGNTTEDISSLAERLQSHLQRLFPKESGFPNPLDFVVPTWETLWRVVITIIARIQEDGSYEDLFQEFIDAEVPLNRQFNTLVGQHGFSVRDFVVESMRLHPPVKRISRIRNCAMINNPTNADSPSHIFSARISSDIPTRGVADIEKVLQDEKIWPEDACSFDPRRHRTGPKTEAQHTLQTETLKLVFGHGPLRCVAASWAPMAAAVIGATIVAQLREAGFKVISGDKIGGRAGWDDWKIIKQSG